MFRLALTLISLATSISAYAKSDVCDRTVTQGDNIPISVPFENGGIAVTFPYPVKDLLPAKGFDISPVAARDHTGQIKNPKTFLIQGSKEGLKGEATFFFAGSDNSYLNLQLVSTKQGKRVLGICFEKSKKTNGSAARLGSEMDMMVSMIRDENKFSRQIINQNIDLPKTDGKLKVRAIRIFRSGEMTGYVFSVTNISFKTLTLNLPNLSFGNPNRGLLIHTDHDTLETCSKNSSPNPKENGCTTFVHLLVDGNYKPDLLTTSEFPFVNQSKNSLN